MRFSELFSKTSKQDPRDEESINARLLIRAGFIRKEVAGVYNFLPLGLRVVNKISNIVREEMNAAGGQEVLLSSLQNKENWVKTGRWKSFDVLFKVQSQFKSEYALGPTHEEVLVPIAAEFVKSYRDLPTYIYQIQNKFRDEPRAKAGLLRGREFLMKDLYSFHTDEANMLAYYDKMKSVYKKTFERLGLNAIETKAAGGTFSKDSHEFQVVCENGEDEIVYCEGKGCGLAENKEITKLKAGDKCPKCAKAGHDEIIKEAKTIEVGNIFPLHDKYSKALNLTFRDRDDKDKFVQMGCYGLGITRAMGAIVEVYHDSAGIIWPKAVAPFDVHLVHIEDPGTESWVKQTYEKLTKVGIEVLWDDRTAVTAGEKFADCDLIGIPTRLVVSKKVGKGKVEIKKRNEKKPEIVSLEKVIS